MGGTIQQALFDAGHVNKEQLDRAEASIERNQRIAANNLKHRERLETVAASLGLNQEFINRFAKRNDTKMAILKELGRSKPGKAPKCTVCKKEGQHYPDNQGTKGETVLYMFFNLCTKCFPIDLYQASLGMSPPRRRNRHVS